MNPRKSHIQLHFRGISGRCFSSSEDSHPIPRATTGSKSLAQTLTQLLTNAALAELSTDQVTHRVLKIVDGLAVDQPVALQLI